MSYGTAFTTTLPTAGVTASPTFEQQLIAREQELEAKLVNKVTEGDIALTTGDITKHGTRPTELAAAAAALVGMTYDATLMIAQASAGSQSATWDLPVQPGQRITKVIVSGQNHGVAWVVSLLKQDASTGTVTQIGTVSSGTSSGTIEARTINATEVVVDGFTYAVRFTSGANLDKAYRCRFEVDRP